jgi:hypothetical protein
MGVGNLLQDYELKRGRANFHLDTLRDSLNRSSERNRLFVRSEHNTEGPKYLFRVTPEPIDPNWSLLIGDFVYERRASLDYLITALVRSAGNQENDRSQFPIYGIDRISWQRIDDWWEKDPNRTIERNLSGTPAGTKASLKKLQPFYGVPATDPIGHPLFVLQTLSNRDKHRRLNLVRHHASLEFVDSDRKPIFATGPSDHRIAETDENGAYTVFLKLESDQKVYLQAYHDVRLHELPDLHTEVIETLVRINQFIDERVLPAIHKLLASQG